MKHFIGGWAIGFMVALWGIKGKPCTSMGDMEFLVYLGAHCFVGCIFGLAAWGLLP